MEGHSLDPEHARQVRETLGPMLRYLNRLKERLLAVGFPPADPLTQLATNAYNALHALNVELHYQSCRSGVGRPPREDAGSKPDAPFTG